LYFGYIKRGGKELSEQELRRREDIYDAIEEWVDLPITQFRDQQDTLPLAEKPPKSAEEIEKCLKRNYSSLWSDLQKLRQEYCEWRNTDIAKKFTKVIEGVSTVNSDVVQDYKESESKRLRLLHNHLTEQIKSEILAKRRAGLKC
jgi:gas vesicle protein